MNKKKILPIIIFILLFLGMAYFSYIPITIIGSLFNISNNDFNMIMHSIYNGLSSMMNLFNISFDSFMLFIKTMYMFIMDLLFIIVLFFVYKDKLIKDFKNYFKKFGENFEQSFKYYFIGVLIMMVSNLIIALFIQGANANNEEAVRSMIDSVPLYMLFSVSIYAPFVEELIFRHSIKDCIMCYGNNKVTKFIYIFTSGFIFAILHIIGVATGYLDYVYLIPYMSLGIAFSALYSKTDNIFSSISMHCLHNTFTIVLYLMVGGGI